MYIHLLKAIYKQTYAYVNLDAHLYTKDLCLISCSMLSEMSPMPQGVAVMRCHLGWRILLWSLIKPTMRACICTLTNFKEKHCTQTCTCTCTYTYTGPILEEKYSTNACTQAHTHTCVTGSHPGARKNRTASTCKSNKHASGVDLWRREQRVKHKLVTSKIITVKQPWDCCSA